WSPDGATLAAYGTDVAVGSSSRNIHAWAFSRSGGAGRDLTEGWDRTVGSSVISDMRSHIQTLPPAWTGDGRILFLGSDQGTANAYSCAAGGGDVRAVTLGEHQVVSWTCDRARRRFAAVVATATDPGNVYVGEVGGAMRKVTCLNDELLGARFVAAPERVEFTGADGWRIEGWLLKPRGFDPTRRWPLVLEIHGGPHTAYGHSFFHEFHVLAGRGYAVLYTNPRGSHAYGQKFVERSPLTYVTNVKTPLLILHAERDLRCPIEQAEQLFTALRVLGKEAVFVRFPEDSHDLTRGGKPRHRVEHCRRIADWFDAHP